MSEYIRDVEKIIDDYHKSSPLFKLNRKSALFKALTVFEDACRLGGSMGIKRLLQFGYSHQSVTSAPTVTRAGNFRCVGATALTSF